MKTFERLTAYWPRLRSIAPDWRTVVSAALIVAAFPPWDLWPLIWFSLVPWMSVLDKKKDLKSLLREGFWLGFFMTLGGLYWVAYVLQEFGNLPWALSVLGLLGFCCFNQLQFPAYAGLLHFTRRFGHARLSWWGTLNALIFAMSYVAIDWIIPKLFMDTLGHSLYKAQAIRQIADLGGAFLLTFLVLFCNDTLYHVYTALRKHKRAQFWPQLMTLVILFALSWKYGQARLEEVHKKMADSTRGAQIAAIQGNIGDFDKIAAERGIWGAANKILDTFMSLTDEALKMNPRPEAVIWPETSFPSTFRTPHSSLEIQLDRKLEDFSKSRGVPIFFGGYDHANDKDYNALFYLAPDGKLQIYRKNILLLFGEYIPGADFFPFIKKQFPQVGNFGRGPGAVHLDFQPIAPAGTPVKSPLRVGPVICYEALFPDYLIESANRGSEITLNITNDSWFGSWGEPQLHLALTAFRSIETRLPMVRTTNTGISTLILPDGEITAATPLNEPRIMNVYVPVTDPIPTLMKSWGDWFGKFSILLALLGLGGLFYRSSVKTS